MCCAVLGSVSFCGGPPAGCRPDTRVVGEAARGHGAGTRGVGAVPRVAGGLSPRRPERDDGGAPGFGNPHCSTRLFAGRSRSGRVSTPTDGAGTTVPGGGPSRPGTAPGGGIHPRSRPAPRSGSPGRPRRRAGRVRPPPPPGTYSSRPPRWWPESCSDIAVPLLRVLHSTRPGRSRVGTAVPTLGSRHRPVTPGRTQTVHSGRHPPTAAIRATGVQPCLSIRSFTDVRERPPRRWALQRRPVLIR